MSRAETTPSATPFPTMHLVIQKTPSGPRAIARSIPFGDDCNATDFAALVMLVCLSDYEDERKNRSKIRQDRIEAHRDRLQAKGKESRLQFPELCGLFGLSYDVLFVKVLPYLLDSNTFQTIPRGLHEEKRPFEKERIENLSLTLHATASSVAIPTTFFSKTYQKGYEIACFLDAAFNADLATVKAILKNSRDPETLLSIAGEIVVDGYPDITRSGTALQFALRSGDTEMVELMASDLPPSEFMRQFESVFGTDFAAFERQQKEDADTLFEGIEKAFKGASPLETTNALNHVNDPTSALQTKLAAFKSALEEYVLKNPTHNDFMLAKAYETYEKIWSPWSIDQLCLFSQQIIGLVQESAKKTSPFRLQDYAQGINYRGENNEASRRSYHLRDTSIDIRSVSCIDILGRRVAGQVWANRGDRPVGKIMSSKNSKLSEIMQRAGVQLRSHDERRCGVM